MRKAPFTDAVSAASQELSVHIADTSLDIEKAQRLRYRVYCEERGFEPGSGGLETDPFDRHASHVLVSSRTTGAVLGTVRVVLPSLADQASFPMNRVCQPFVLAPLPIASTGEISRFALTRDRTGISPAAAALMRLCLMRGIVEVSGIARLTHWCAIMESSLLRLLRATAIYFEPVGPAVEYHGVRQPAVGSIDTILNRIRREQPVVWSFITGNGALWMDHHAAAAQVSLAS